MPWTNSCAASMNCCANLGFVEKRCVKLRCSWSDISLVSSTNNIIRLKILINRIAQLLTHFNKLSLFRNKVRATPPQPNKSRARQWMLKNVEFSMEYGDNSQVKRRKVWSNVPKGRKLISTKSVSHGKFSYGKFQFL